MEGAAGNDPPMSAVALGGAVEGVIGSGLSVATGGAAEGSMHSIAPEGGIAEGTELSVVSHGGTSDAADTA